MDEYRCWYSVWSIDAWLEEDGEDEFWEYNAKTKIAQIELPSDDECNLSLEDIVKALYEAEIITTNDWRRFDIEEYGAYPHPSLAVLMYGKTYDHYDCTKVQVGKAIRDDIFEYYKRQGKEEFEIGMLWVCYGPKATLEGYDVECEDDWATDGA